MNVDSAFTAGAHRICEDYTLAKDNIIIVCDGCSSEDDTDIGARILAKSAQRILASYPTYDHYWATDGSPLPPFFSNNVISNADVIRSTMGLDSNSLYTTFLFAVEYKKVVRACCFGDGVIIARKKNGETEIKDISFPSGAPYYIRYELNPEDKQKYLEKFENIKYSIVGYSYNEQNGFKKTYSGFELVINPEKAHYPIFDVRFSTDEYDLIALFSDGVHSFHRPVKTETGITQQRVDFLEIIKELVDFKGYTGEFVQRRLNKAMKKFHELDYKNMDDVSVAAMYLGE